MFRFMDQKHCLPTLKFISDNFKTSLSLSLFLSIPPSLALCNGCVGLTQYFSFLLTAWVQFIFLSGNRGSWKCGRLWSTLISSLSHRGPQEGRDLPGRQCPPGHIRELTCGRTSGVIYCAGIHIDKLK